MRKIIIAAVVITVAIACASRKNSLVKYKTIELEEKIPLIEGDPDSIGYHVEFHYTDLIDYPNKKALNDAKKELTKQFFDIQKQEFTVDPIENFKSILVDLETSYRKEALELKKEYGEMSYMLNYELIKSSKIIYNKNKVLIVELETYVYSGGAHGIGNKSYLHFNMQSGHTFELKDLLKEGGKEAINKLLLEKVGIMENDEDNMLFSDAKPKANENFYFDEQNMYFVYNPYEIAPYAAGYVVLEIPFSKIETIVTKKGPLKQVVGI